MGKRILTTVIGLPILYFVLNKGGAFLAFSLFFVTLIGLHEFYSGVRQGGYQPVAAAGYGMTLILYVIVFLEGEKLLNTSLLPLIMVLMLSWWVLSPRKIFFDDVLITWFGFMYVAGLLFSLLHIDRMPIAFAVWLPFVVSWSSDSLAYLTGLAIGKHKLAPAISPKKTVEGSVGGLAGGMLGCFIFGLFFMPEHIFPLTLMGLTGSLVSQLGDLTASLIKRKVGIKDFGKIFPGHGGILDRFDSILFAGPLVYVFLSYWMVN